MHNFLLDEEFLKELFNSNTRETYARVISLDINERPKETLEGKITQGNLNIDGSSRVRRTCSLTFSVPDTEAITSYYWGLTTKFKLEVGVKNEINSDYPDICYFPFGVFIINSFTLSKGTNNYSISISGKDKMCLINGDVGGELYAQVDFGTEDDYTTIDEDTGLPIKKVNDLEIENIIREAVHNYAHEPYQNIVIKDIPKYGMFMLKFMGGTSDNTTTDRLFAYISIKTSSEIAQETDNNDLVDFNVVNKIDYGTYTTADKTTTRAAVNAIVAAQSYTIDGLKYVIPEQTVNINTDDTIELTGTIDGSSASIPFQFYDYGRGISDDGVGIKHYTKVKTTDSGNEDLYCVIAKISKGEPAGYKITNLTYPRDVDDENSGLVISVGDTIITMLDKIVTMLGDYEYFYNEYGQFVFQKKNGYLDRNWKTNEFEANSVTGTVDINALPSTIWSFEDSHLVTSYNNNPNISDIKNDYSIWGENENDKPIHMRYAIDHKPTRYVTVRVDQDEVDGYKTIHPEFSTMKAQTSITYISEDADYDVIPSDTVKIVDWRELIYQMSCDYLKYNHFDTFLSKIEEANNYIDDDGNMITPYPGGITGYECYYVDVNGFWRQLYKPYDPLEYINTEKTIAAKDIDITPNSFYTDKLAYDVFVKGTYSLSSKDKTHNMIYIPKDSNDTTNSDLVIDLRDGGYTSIANAIDKNRLICAISDEGYVLNPYDCEKYPTYPTGYPDSLSDEDFIYYNDGGKYPDLESINIIEGLNYTTIPFLVTRRINIDEEFFTKYSEVQKLTPEECEAENIDFLTAYIYNNKAYMFRSKENKSEDTVDGIVLQHIFQSTFRHHAFYNGGEDTENYQKYTICAIGPHNSITRVQIDSRAFTCPDDFVYLTDMEQVKDKKFTPVLESIGELNNIVYNDKNAVYFYYSEDGYTSISNMSIKLKPIFLTGNYSIFNRSNYRSTYRLQIRYTNGDFGEIANIDIVYYQADKDKIKENNDSGYTQSGWCLKKFTSPESLYFWFDFLDAPTQDIGRMGVNYIMDRAKAVNEDEIKVIYYRDNLNLFYLLNDESTAYEDDGYEEENSDLNDARNTYNAAVKEIEADTSTTDEEKETKKETALATYYATIKEICSKIAEESESLTAEEIEQSLYLQESQSDYTARKYKESLALQKRLIPYIENTYSKYTYVDNVKEAAYFQVMNVGKSCKEVLDQYLYNYTYATETVTIVAAPVYHLQPNDVVLLNDKESMLQGKFIINSISLPLTYNGTMSINATKYIEALY